MSLRLTQGDENHLDSPIMILRGLEVVFDCAAVIWASQGFKPLRYVCSAVCLELHFLPTDIEKRTSAAEAVKRRPSMARLKPCPSFRVIAQDTSTSGAKARRILNRLWPA